MPYHMSFAALVMGVAVATVTPAFADPAPAPASPSANTPAPKPALIKAEAFARDAYMSVPQISPDGTRLAYARGNDIVIYDLSTESEKTLSAGGNDLDSVDWINNDLLVVYLKTNRITEARALNIQAYSPLVITKDAKFVRELFEQKGKTSVTDLRPIINFVDGEAPYVVTLGDNSTYVTDVATGSWKTGPRLMDGESHFFDNKGLERLSVTAEDGKVSYGITAATLRYRETPDGPVKTLHLPKQANTYYTNFHFGEADKSLYWSQFDYDKSVASIYRFDMTTQAQTVFKTGNSRDLDLVMDKDGRVLGTETTADRIQITWTDAYRLKLTAAVQKVFPKAEVVIMDMTPDGKNVVLWVSAPEEPDSYYYYNADSQYLTEIGGDYPELDGEMLGEMTYVTYKARDGLDIPAYVTKRKDTPAGAPLIVFPHGGPAARDTYGFNYMAQFLASRGYVVLQPQYRGSSGFGDSFERAGNMHLDQMTTDLEDGVKYLAAQGTIDPKRVCIVGWSWGGYLADAGVTLSPGTYACGVSGAGVADLYELLGDDNDTYWGGYGIEYWHSIIGRQVFDDAKIAATSPVMHVDAVKVPLLLIHGDLDPVVSVHQSQRMAAAMKKAGKPVTYTEIKYMHHGPDTEDQRLQVLKEMDSFIADALAKIDKTGAPAAAK